MLNIIVRGVFVGLVIVLLGHVGMVSSSVPDGVGEGFWQCGHAGISDPCRRNFNDIEPAGGNRAWAVGDNGVIAHLIGANTTIIPSPVVANFMAVSVINDNNVWVYGEQRSDSGQLIPVLLQWNGSSFQEMPAPDRFFPLDLQMFTNTDGWALGAAGPARWNGSSWQNISAPLDVQELIQDMHFVSSDEGWFVGQHGNPQNWQLGFILRWKDGQFERMNVPPVQPNPPVVPRMNSVFANSPNDVWFGSDTGELLQWNGSEITLKDFDDSFVEPEPEALNFSATNDGWLTTSSGLYHWNGSNWQKQSRHVGNKIGMNSPNSGWLIKELGEIIYWNGTYWGGSPAPPSDIKSVDFQDGTGWFVGDKGLSAQRQNNDWVLAPSLTTNDLFDVDLHSGQDGWAVGENNTALRYHNGNWSVANTPDIGDIVRVVSHSDDVAWAISTGWPSKLIRWNGSTWQEISRPNSNAITDLDIYSATHVWYTDTDGKAVHWNGSTWRIESPPRHGVPFSIKILSENNIRIVSESGSTHWNGTEWVTIENGQASLFDWHDSAWGVGLAGLIQKEGKGVWEEFASPTGENLNHIGFNNENDIWAVGPNSLIHWNGTSWRTISSAPDSFQNDKQTNLAIDMISPTEGWAVGVWGHNRSVMSYFDGTQWHKARNPNRFSLYDIDMLSSDIGWAVGDAGTMLRRENGLWHPVPKPNNESAALRGVSVLSEDSVWLVGKPAAEQSALVWHWNGTAVAEVQVPASSPLAAIQMLDENTGWAVGPSEYALHWNGSNWLTQTLPSSSNLTALHMLSATEGWAVGNFGTIVRYQNGSWSEVASPTNATLNSIHMKSTGEGWIIGDSEQFNGQGVMLYWDGTSWTKQNQVPLRNFKDFDYIDADNQLWGVGEHAVFRQFQLPEKVYLPLITR